METVIVFYGCAKKRTVGRARKDGPFCSAVTAAAAAAAATGIAGALAGNGVGSAPLTADSSGRTFTAAVNAFVVHSGFRCYHEYRSTGEQWHSGLTGPNCIVGQQQPVNFTVPLLPPCRQQIRHPHHHHQHHPHLTQTQIPVAPLKSHVVY
jgi:hypothetical protein